MEETIVLNPLDLQVVDAEYVFEPSTIHRMEILVLNTLSWRMQAVTPCSFIDYYLHKFSDGDVVSKIILSRAVELILSTSKVAEFLVFRPSEIAASIALVALGKHESSVLESVATCRKELRKERVLGCYEMVQDKIVMGDIIIKSVGSSVFPKQHSPTGVLGVVACESQQYAMRVHQHAKGGGFADDWSYFHCQVSASSSLEACQSQGRILVCPSSSEY